MANAIRAGWYPNIEHAGGQRHWDGGAWTDKRTPAAPPPPPPNATAAQGQGQVVYVEKAGNGVAVGAMVCGIVGAVFGLVPILRR